jgi:hypothetical protein
MLGVGLNIQMMDDSYASIEDLVTDHLAVILDAIGENPPRSF